ncbi:hypothetical protein DL93DRAFT_2086112 [Clavulina sp. PMI_390]|nr:hypothetical protein DL93DRAFT_2086112 [Clavulina sp. PMI_390]
MLINTRPTTGTQPNHPAAISLEEIVPVASSTPRVAATAFYHCLALTTKGLLQLHQDGAYGVIWVNLASARPAHAAEEDEESWSEQASQKDSEMQDGDD